MAELAGVLVGNYFLLECVAREGMVETYCTRPTTRGGVDVILRLFRPEFPDPTSFREHFAEEVEKVWRSGLIGASFFVFSLPAHMTDLRAISFLNAGHAGDAVATATKIATKAGRAGSTPTGTTTTKGLPPSSQDKATAQPLAPTIPVPTIAVSPAPLPLNCATGTLSIDGSQSFGPLLQQLGDDYQNYCPGFILSLGGCGN